MNAIHELIKKRRSTVLFEDKPIGEDSIQSLFEAARWAPSSRNEQPWRFIYVLKSDPDFTDWLDCLAVNNQKWAKNASMLLLTAAQLISDYNSKENPYAVHDTAMAYSNLVFQALAMGLSVHPMGGYDKEKIKTQVSLSEGFKPLVVAAIGYKSDSVGFDDELVKRENRERTRKPIESIAFRHKYHHPVN